jgi:plasmid stabilization system protein ParE
MILRYHELARKEVIEATEYYARARPELAADFLAELATAVEAIVANPEAFEQVRPGIRRYLLDRFPYGIYYRMPDENTVRIIVVRHHSRRPGYGLRRK